MSDHHTKKLLALPWSHWQLSLPTGVKPRRARATVVRAALTEDVGTAGKAAIALGLVANPLVLWSEWTLKTTGSGLPPGPGGALGAAGW